MKTIQKVFKGQQVAVDFELRLAFLFHAFDLMLNTKHPGPLFRGAETQLRGLCMQVLTSRCQSIAIANFVCLCKDC